MILMLLRYLFFLLLASVSFIFSQSNSLELIPDEKFPKWLKDVDLQANQTSGIAFLNNDGCKSNFLIVDDIGDIHLLKIYNDDNIRLEKIGFSDAVKSFLSGIPKADFEEITFDHHSNSYYLSIEGNGPAFKDHLGIYQLEFCGSENSFHKVKSMNKINFYPEETFLMYTMPNIGYEGFAVDKNYFYLGLEGIVNNYQFADSTLIFIADKSNQQIIKEISTKNFNIQSVCGLFSDKDYSLWGIDRNQRKIFHINFDINFEIIDFNLYDCSTNIPDYPEYNYRPSFESITIDSNNFLYLVDDPWREAFIPSEDILIKLDERTVKNFKDLVPTIFRYTIKYK